jgi:hypothetical protein
MKENACIDLSSGSVQILEKGANVGDCDPIARVVTDGKHAIRHQLTHSPIVYPQH